MEIRKRTIPSVIDNEYLEYAKYVLYNRALPQFVDGFKPVQRKIFYVMRSHKDLVKVASVSGEVIQKANYHHGDGSCNAAITAMTQDFPGSNNYPFFLKKGAFGSQLVPNGAAAARYVFVKTNPLMNYIFKDWELCPPSSDLEDPEPQYYLPIIPTVLLNGIRGIAIGFATEIQPRNIHDIISNIKKILNSEEPVQMLPYFKGYTGKVIQNDSGIYQCGVMNITKANECVITEVPTDWSREQYLAHLNKLEEKEKIKRSTDKSKTNWNIEIKTFPSVNLQQDGFALFKLATKLSENITVIDQNGALKVYKSAEELLKDFVTFRCGIYQQRINYQIKRIEKEIRLLQKRIEFIQYFDQIRSMRKNQLIEFLKTKNYQDDEIQFCISLKIYQFTVDEIELCQEEIKKLEAEKVYYQKVTVKELYFKDLDELVKQLK